MTTRRSGAGAANPKVVDDCHDLLLWLIPHLDRFPRVRRFTLGERIESGLLTTLELLVDAAWRRDKRAVLVRANRQIEILRHLWRIAYELRVIPIKRYEFGATEIDNIGRQVGAWIKAS